MRTWICARCFTQLTGETAGVCPSCGAEEVVPLESPRGQALLSQAMPMGPPAQAQAVAMPRPPVALPPTRPGDVVCPSCLSVGQPLKTGTGPVGKLIFVLMTIVAFIFIWPVGLLFLLLLMVDAATSKTKCRGCGNVGVIPATSPGARDLLRRNLEMQGRG